MDLVEMAWHDCHGEVTPPDAVVGDMLTLGGGTIDGMIRAARLAVVDRRDLSLTARDRRDRRDNTN